MLVFYLDLVAQRRMMEIREYHGFSTTFELFELVKLSSLHWLSGVAYGDDERKYERVKSCVR